MDEKKITNITVQRAQSQIHTDGGVLSIDGPDGIALYRLLTIKSGMELEMKGMRLTSRRKAPSCFTIARNEFGLKGNKRRIYEQFCQMHGFDPKPEETP